MYGGEPFAFEDTAFNNGGQGLKCIGFSPIASIQDKYLVEDDSGNMIKIVVPQKNATVSAKRFAAVLKAMHNMQIAIVARYTYRYNTAPKLMALFPDEDSMLMYQLYFKESYIELEFPRLNAKSTEPTSQQLEFMDKFIDSMDLTDGGHFEKLQDPGLQYQFRAIAHRAIRPDEPLLKVDNDILSLITPPKPVDVEGLQANFPLKAAKLTGKEAFLDNIRKFENDAEDATHATHFNKADYTDLHEIGTIKPADDFMQLLERGEPFNVLIEQMQKIVTDLVVKSLVAMDEKILHALAAYRETAKQKGPYKYNEWIKSFKELLKQREKIALWHSLVQKSLGLITENESEMSTIKEEEAQAFIKIEDFSTQNAQSNNNEFEDSNVDMFDEM